MRILVTIGCLLGATAAAAQNMPDAGDAETLFTSRYSPILIPCVKNEHAAGRDFANCRGLVESVCHVETATPSEDVLCLLEEEFAWRDTMLATLPDFMGVAEGKTQISAEAYITEITERMQASREKCFAFLPHQIAEQTNCQIDADLAHVKWHLDLYDNGV